jgi:hypothetical protein
MRQNEAAMEKVAAGCQQVLAHASSYLKILDPEVGDEELIKAVAVEQAKLRRL